MRALLVLHVLLALGAPWLTRHLGTRAFYVLALGPLAAAVWAATQAREVIDGEAVTSRISWVPGLDLAIDLRLDPLALLMVFLVGGIGALVFGYCAHYFRDDDPRIARFAAVLTAFAGAMLGLVLADNVLLLYVFWELTSVTSFLLIGHTDEEEESRRAAMQALLVTTLGGLVMLLGLILLGLEAGTYRLSEMLAAPPGGTTTSVALVLLLIGAFTKSAQIPFHPWLPAAMAAPTPVSAYLHAAAMVKAGVYLVARFAPGFAEAEIWRPLVITVGAVTMIVGGWRAMRQTDLKRLLAFGTVSQLGFLIVLTGAGTAEAALAGATLLLAHALFKACLFLTVGIIDHETGTRDVRVLSGLATRMPVLCVAASLAAVSMAAVPPLFGFVAKEAAYEAFVHGDAADIATLATLVVGSIFTGAYSFRFIWGAFASKPGVPATRAHTPSVLFLAPVVLLSATTVVLGAAPGLADPLMQAYAASYPNEPGPPHLALWHGFGAALTLSMITLLGAALLFVAREPVRTVQRSAHRLFGRVDADRAYAQTLHGVDRVALGSTRLIQTGSLPLYLALILLTLTLMPGLALLARTRVSDDVTAWDTPLQLFVALVIAAAAVATAVVQHRLTAVLCVGAVGYGVAVLFVIHGGPDLALTQFLVETLTLVIFVFVLRRLPTRFTRQPLRWSQPLRLALSVGVGVFVTCAVLISTQARTADPVAQDFLDRSLPEGGGRNVVNVILVDFRGFDTLGEITVLVVAAMGVSALVLAGRARRSAAVSTADLAPPGDLAAPEREPAP